MSPPPDELIDSVATCRLARSISAPPEATSASDSPCSARTSTSAPPEASIDVIVGAVTLTT
jgi:hypothetical protein